MDNHNPVLSGTWLQTQEFFCWSKSVSREKTVHRPTLSQAVEANP